MSASGIAGYSATTTATLEVSDEPTSEDRRPGEAVSGILSLELRYQGVACPLAVSLTRDPVSRADPASLSATFDLVPNDTPYQLRDFTLVITDVAGNVSFCSLSSLAAQAFSPASAAPVHSIIVDATAPTMTVDFDTDEVANDCYYRANRLATFTVTEAHFGALQKLYPTRAIVQCDILGKGSRSIPASVFTNPSGDGRTWVYEMAFTTEDDFTLSSSFSDALDNALTPDFLPQHFIIDKTPPLVFVSFDNNEAHDPGYYKAPRTATVRVVERNFSADLMKTQVLAIDGEGRPQTAPQGDAWQLAGIDEYWSSIYFDTEFHFFLAVDSLDLAGNQAQTFELPEFIIDMTAPVITIENIKDTQAIGGAVVPRVTFTDENLKPTWATAEFFTAAGRPSYQYLCDEKVEPGSKVQSYHDLAYLPSNDNVYLMKSQVLDKAGNQARDSRIFSVNRFGSTYLFSPSTQALANSYLKAPQELVVTEINVSGLVASETIIRISATGEMRTLKKDVHYTDTPLVNPVTLWSSNTYVISADTFTQDAFYRVLLRSIDQADNLSENSMQKNSDRSATAELDFVLDTTPPTGSIINVEAGGVYALSSRQVQLRFSDNLAYDHARLLVDGEECAYYAASGLEFAGSGSIELESLEYPRNLRLEIVDKAGHLTTIQKDNVIVAADVLLPRWQIPLPSAPAAFSFWPSGLIAGIVFSGILLLLILLIRGRYRRRPRREVALSSFGPLTNEPGTEPLTNEPTTVFLMDESLPEQSAKARDR
jgi:hypothetical protein